MRGKEVVGAGAQHGGREARILRRDHSRDDGASAVADCATLPGLTNVCRRRKSSATAQPPHSRALPSAPAPTLAKTEPPGLGRVLIAMNEEDRRKRSVGVSAASAGRWWASG